ncbi:MAG: Actin cross-linking toxin VgrG1 [Desulfovibrio sp.]
MALQSNAAWFTIAMQGDFSVYAFSGKEEVNKPYEFNIELVSKSFREPIANLPGTEACLTITDRSGGTRVVHGLIALMEQGHTGNRFTRYYCKLVPRLWFLDQIRDHRIFQNLSVPEIIQKILHEQGFTDTMTKFALFYTYEPREYCVQYGESDLHFISRLCEEEGLYFYFEHAAGSHTLCFCDREGGPRITGESDIRYYPGGGQTPDTAVISAVRYKHSVNSNAAAYREWNFKKPKLNLEVKSAGDGPTPAGMLLEQYHYPHIYDLQASGTRYANLQVLRQLTYKERVELDSDVSRFLPSFTFSIHDHPRGDINAKWWVTAVRHEGEQPQVLEHEAPSERGMTYQSVVTAIPDKTRFIPLLEHPRNVVIGQQTAIVTGPEGEEIYTDQYGRVKVQFFWDREGQRNEKTTCWIRVSQGWAGTQYGAMTIPRIGHEVVVSFLEGNADRPLITGRVYHELNRVPYPLPDHKTRSVFKSMSTPGIAGKPRGFNELRVEDKAGEEEIYLRAEKDVNTYTKNDWKDHILHDKHETVDNFRYTHVKKETHETLGGQRKTELFANDNITIHADSHMKVDGDWLVKAAKQAHLQSGGKMVLESEMDLTLKAGGHWIRITPAGITTSPTFNIGSGSPASGKGAAPLLPEGAVPTEPGVCPTCIAALEEAEKDDAPFSGSCVV